MQRTPASIAVVARPHHVLLLLALIGIDTAAHGAPFTPPPPPLNTQHIPQYNSGLIHPSQISMWPDNLHTFVGSGPGVGDYLGHVYFQTGDAYVQQVGNQVSVYVPIRRDVLFVSSAPFWIEEEELIPPTLLHFGSALVADVWATALASSGGLIENWDSNSILYKAVLTTPFTDLQSRAGIGARGYVNTLGQEIAATTAQLMSGIHSAPILTEHGLEVISTNMSVWTGANPDGSWSGFDADNWSNPFNSTATVGTINGTGTQWISNGTRSSALNARFYAVNIGGAETMYITGYDLELVYTIPEPSTLVLAICGALALLVTAQQRRRRFHSTLHSETRIAHKRNS